MLAQFERAGERFRQEGVRAVAVAMCTPEQAEAFCGRRAPSLTCLCDRSMSAYAAYGLRRGNFLEVMGPAAVAAGIRASAAGHRIGTPVGDTWMMPGTFAIDQRGIIRAVHYARHSGDQPRLDTMLAALAAPAATTE